MVNNSMMQWILVNHDTGRPLNDRLYLNESTARQDLVRLGEAFGRLYWAVPAFCDPYWSSVLLEGFSAGDLDGILLPQFSVDVYVPGDPKTDNVVVGFFIKGVPEAVFPFKNFCTYSRGVKHVDYGDSDTLPHTSIVYAEFDRDRFNPKEFDDLVHEVCRLANITPEDFSVTFPNTNKNYPYSVELIDKYFRNRSEQKNRLAQVAAVHDRNSQIQKDLEKELQSGNIGQHLDGSSGTAKTDPHDGGLKRLKRIAHIGPGMKPDAKKNSSELNDATKSMIINDAKRNLGSHTETWEQFDSRWASRLRVTPTRVNSVRKRIYDT